VTHCHAEIYMDGMRAIQAAREIGYLVARSRHKLSVQDQYNTWYADCKKRGVFFIAVTRRGREKSDLKFDYLPGMVWHSDSEMLEAIGHKLVAMDEVTTVRLPQPRSKFAMRLDSGVYRSFRNVPIADALTTAAAWAKILGLGKVGEPPRVVSRYHVRVEEGFKDETHLLVIDHCPYCGEKHVHGAGGSDVYPERRFVTHRVAHCLLQHVGETARLGYWLLDELSFGTHSEP
jgi:hypothetical protein